MGVSAGLTAGGGGLGRVWGGGGGWGMVGREGGGVAWGGGIGATLQVAIICYGPRVRAIDGHVSMERHTALANESSQCQKGHIK